MSLLSQSAIEGLRAAAAGIQTETVVQSRFDPGSTARWTLTVACTSLVLIYDGHSTASLTVFTAAALQTALSALTGVGAGNITVTGADGGPFTITLAGSLAHKAAKTFTATPTGGTATLAVVTAGGTFAASGYLEIGSLAAQIVPPGYKFNLNAAAPDYLRGIQLATLKVAVTADIQAKDRLATGGRLFEVVAPITPKSIEIRRKFLVREIAQPERVLYFVLLQIGVTRDSAASNQPRELIRCLPFALVQDRGIDSVDESGSLARLKKIEVGELSNAAYALTQDARFLHCILVPSDVAPTAENEVAGLYPRYRFDEASEYRNDLWASAYPWRVGLIKAD